MFLPYPGSSTYLSSSYRPSRQDHRVLIGWLLPRLRQFHTFWHVGKKTSKSFVEFKALWHESLHNNADELASQRLSVRYCIDFKVATLTYKVLQSGEPSYLSSIINIDDLRRQLHSSDNNYTLADFQFKIKIGSQAYRHSAPSIWKSTN